MSENEKESILLRMKSGLTSIPKRLKNVPKSIKNIADQRLKDTIMDQNDHMKEVLIEKAELEDSLKLYKTNKNELVHSTVGQFNKIQHLEDELKQSQIEIAALTEICYKKTEESLIAKKELEIYKKEMEIEKKIKEKTNPSEYTS